jgi:hypothetical protein
VYPKTHVWVFEVKVLHHIGAIDELSRELRKGCEQPSETIAVGAGVGYDYDAFGNLVNQAE